MTAQQQQVYNSIIMLEATINNYQTCIKKGFAFVGELLKDLLILKQHLESYYMSVYGSYMITKSKIVELKVENEIAILVDRSYNPGYRKLMESAVLSNRAMLQLEALMDLSFTVLLNNAITANFKRLKNLLDKLFDQKIDQEALNDAIVKVDEVIDEVLNSKI